jgi:ABC-type sugar transport system permease subunit
MGRQAIPVGLVVAAAAADGAGAHGLAFYALVLAVPAAAVVALDTFGRLLDGTQEHLHALLWTVVLALIVVGAAVRAPAVTEGAVPALARSALLACLVIFCVQAVSSLAAELRRR